MKRIRCRLLLFCMLLAITLLKAQEGEVLV
jgi:hypothetical protein